MIHSYGQVCQLFWIVKRKGLFCSIEYPKESRAGCHTCGTNDVKHQNGLFAMIFSIRIKIYPKKRHKSKENEIIFLIMYFYEIKNILFDCKLSAYVHSWWITVYRLVMRESGFQWVSPLVRSCEVWPISFIWAHRKNRWNKIIDKGVPLSTQRGTWACFQFVPYYCFWRKRLPRWGKAKSKEEKMLR